MAQSDGEVETHRQPGPSDQTERSRQGNGVGRSKSFKHRGELERRPSALQRLKRRLSRQKDPIRLVLLGACEVGKSSILARIRANSFPVEYEATFSERLQHSMMLRGRLPETVEFLDVTGATASEYKPMRERAIAEANIYILVYSVKSQASLQYLEGVFEDIQEACPHLGFDDIGPKCLLIGNQANEENLKEVVAGTDAGEEALIIAPRAVSEEHAQTFATKWNIKGIIETSALTAFGIADIDRYLRKNVQMMTSRSISVSSASSNDESQGAGSFLTRFKSMMRRRGPSPIPSDTEQGSPARKPSSKRNSSTSTAGSIGFLSAGPGGGLKRSEDIRHSYQGPKTVGQATPGVSKPRRRTLSASIRRSFRRKKKAPSRGESPAIPEASWKEDAM
eukprot:scpid56049/ scgid11353/ Cell division control protein 42